MQNRILFSSGKLWEKNLRTCGKEADLTDGVHINPDEEKVDKSLRRIPIRRRAVPEMLSNDAL